MQWVTLLPDNVRHWTAKHPEWDGPDVSSYAIDDGERLLLFDPIAPPSEIEELAAERETAVVLTAPWHERDTQRLVERLGVPVHTPPSDTAEYLMETYGLTAEQAGDGSPDVVWLLKEGIGEAHPYAAGDRPARCDRIWAWSLRRSRSASPPYVS